MNQRNHPPGIARVMQSMPEAGPCFRSSYSLAPASSWVCVVIAWPGATVTGVAVGSRPDIRRYTSPPLSLRHCSCAEAGAVSRYLSVKPSQPLDVESLLPSSSVL